MKYIHLRPILAFCGALPFIACAILSLFSIVELPILGKVEAVIAAYSLAIISFMAGSLWGSLLQKNGLARDQSRYIILASNALTVIAWLVFLALPSSLAILVYILIFICLLALDFELKRANKISSDYLRLRTQVTAIVVISLVIYWISK